jgi:demethoxyubiquinone hydroxylase (CLK1/Coq7/Cat5 family)
VALLFLYLQRRRLAAARPPLSDEERARAQALIRTDSTGAS